MSDSSNDIKIIGLTGQFKDTEFYINKPEFIVGRSKDCDLLLDEKTVSGKHAKFIKVDDHYELHDLK